MKKRLFSLLLAALLLLAPALPAYAQADITLASEEDLLDYLKQQKEAGAEEFEFYCTSALYQTLMDDDGRQLSFLQVKAGIASASISHSDGRRQIRFTSVTYTDAPWQECANELEAQQAAEQLLADGATVFTLLCPKNVAVNLANDGSLRNVAARAGYGDADISYYRNGIVRVKGVTPFDGPYAVAEDDDQFAAALRDFADRGIDDFTVVFTPVYYARLNAAKENLDILCYTNGIESFANSTLYGCPAALHFFRVEYTDEPCLVCRTEEDVVEAISQMGAEGHAAFRLYLPDSSLMNRLEANSMSRLHELEAKAGMYDSSLRYSSTMLHYSEAKIVANPRSLSTAADAIAYMDEMAAGGAEEIPLFCSDSLYRKLIGNLDSLIILDQDGMELIYDLITHAGIFDYDLSASRSTRAIVVTVKAYYPGTEILQAVDGFQIHLLPQRLQQTLLAALRMAAACQADTDLETARNIHDALCEQVVYTLDDNSDEDDTAVGALLNGQANCDGYADAFYLVGTLAGLHVRYQHGDSLVSGSGFSLGVDRETHMWNLLELDGTWRMVDVTWDDDEEYPVEYTWFNLGYDRASRTHVWNEEMTVALQKETDLSSRPENEYTVTDAAGMRAAVDAAAGNQPFFTLIFENENYTDYQAALELLSKLLPDGYRHSWEPKMRQLRVYTD